jgi:hypothetical protein
VTFLVDKVAHGPVFLGVVCFTLSLSFNQCSVLTFILIQYYSYQKDKSAKCDNLQKSSTRSEIGEDLIEELFQSQVVKSVFLDFVESLKLCQFVKRQVIFDLSRRLVF